MIFKKKYDIDTRVLEYNESIEYVKFNYEFFMFFPELSDKFLDLDHIDCGRTILFEDVFLKDFIRVIEINDVIKIQNYFDYIETLIKRNIYFEINAVDLCIINRLTELFDIDELINEYGGKYTKLFASDKGKYLPYYSLK